MVWPFTFLVSLPARLPGITCVTLGMMICIDHGALLALPASRLLFGIIGSFHFHCTIVGLGGAILFSLGSPLLLFIIIIIITLIVLFIIIILTIYHLNIVISFSGYARAPFFEHLLVSVGKRAKLSKGFIKFIHLAVKTHGQCIAVIVILP